MRINIGLKCMQNLSKTIRSFSKYLQALFIEANEKKANAYKKTNEIIDQGYLMVSFGQFWIIGLLKGTQGKRAVQGILRATAIVILSNTRAVTALLPVHGQRTQSALSSLIFNYRFIRLCYIFPYIQSLTLSNAISRAVFTMLVTASGGERRTRYNGHHPITCTQ